MIAILDTRPDFSCQIFDFDTKLEFPCNFIDYFENAIKNDDGYPEQYHR